MTFGIREKVSLLVFLAASGSAFLVARGLATKSREVLREHELVDLGDEAQLRGWTLSDKVDGLAEDLGNLTFNQEFYDAVRAGVSSERLAEMARGICRRYWKEYVHIDIVQIGSEKTTVRPIHTTIDLGEEYQWLPEDISGQLHLSPIKRVPVIYPANGEFPARIRGEPIIWGIAPLSRFGMTFDDPQNYVRIATNLAVPPSSRQFYVLENEKGEQLQRADELLEKDEGNDEVFRKLSQDGLLRAKLEEFRHALANTSQPRVRSLIRKDSVKLDRTYYFVEGMPAEKIATELEFDNVAFHEELRKSGSEIGRIGGLSAGVKQLRLMADSREKLRTLQEMAIGIMKKHFGPNYDGITWRGVVECDEIHSSAVQVLIGAGDDIDRYVIHYAVMEDELASSMDYEMKSVRLWAVVIALGAGIVGFVMAMFFIRPLKTMTVTAQKISESKGDLSVQLKVLASKLAIKRRDEVGEIARASKRLFEEIIDANDKLEQRVIARTTDLRKANRDLEQANVRLKSLSHEKDSFVAKVSHDLRQPLNAIFLQVEALKLSELNDLQKEDVEKINLHANRELNLVNDILEYQKIIMGAETLIPDKIEPLAMVRDLETHYRPIAEVKGVGFEVACPITLGPFTADERRTRQVLGNLLSNACKFTKEGTVTLSVEPRSVQGEDWIEFSVTDTGRGMSPDEQSKAFVPFVSNKKDNASGTGLGLSICKELTERMGGKIGFMSALGEGTSFTVLMPVKATAVNYRQHKDAPGKPKDHIADGEEALCREELIGDVGVVSSPMEAAEQIARHAEASTAGEGAKILVIDDEPSVRELLKRLLEGDGYTVITAEDGHLGLEAAMREKPAAITLDVVLPGDKDGWAVLKELKAHPETENIPVIMVSIMAEQDNGFALDVEDYLVKPIDIDRLSRVVSRATQSAPQRNLLIVDDDVDSREALARILKESGWLSQFAFNGLEALEMLKKTRPAAIVLDLMMPEMDGFEFLRTIQTDPRLASIPVIVMTGKEPTIEERKFLEKRVGMILRKGEDSGSKRVLHTITQKLRHRPEVTSN